MNGGCAVADVAAFLGQSWWQGIGAVFAIIAAALALWAVIIGVRQQRGAAAPMWYFDPGGIQTQQTSDPAIMRTVLRLWNAGTGAATTPWLTFDVEEGPGLCGYSLGGAGSLTLIAPGGSLQIIADWRRGAPTSGWFELSCTSPLGHEVVQRCRLRCANAGAVAIASMEPGKPAIQARPRRRPAAEGSASHASRRDWLEVPRRIWQRARGRKKHAPASE